MTATVPHSPVSLSPRPFRVVRVSPEHRAAAAARLVSGSTRDPHLGAKRFLAAAAMHHIDLTHLWGSVSIGAGPDEGPGRRLAFRQACLAVPGAGRTAMFFTSPVASADEEAELAAVIEAAAGGLGAVKLGQALLEPREGAAARAFTAAGFRRLTMLAYLRRELRPAPAPGPQAWPEGIEVGPWRAGDDASMLRAMERSYIDTLDCPELCGLRETADVLASHKAAGAHDPRWWWLVRFRGEPSGAMLFNPSPEQDAVELVYLGLAPELRGMRLGRRLMALGIAALQPRRERWITCAVDERNAPARALYLGIGFDEFAQRIALVKPL